jgi:hypothetical protein
MLLVNRIIRSSTLKTPVKRFIKRLELALKRTTSKNALLQKKNTKYRELLWVYRERKNGKHVAIAVKFVSNKKEILKLVKEAENKVSKKKTKKRQIMKAITPKIKEEEEEHIKEDTSKSKSDYIIVVSSRSKLK